MRIAIISLDQVWENKLENIRRIEEVLQKIKTRAEYVIFPELTLTGFTMQSNVFYEELVSSESISVFSSLAKAININLIFGMITKNGDSYSNTCIAMNRKGDIEGTYNKLHPFSYSKEHENYIGGTQLGAVDWPGGWGLTICYDLRFPELFQALSKNNAVIVNIANWPKARINHWYSLLVARAIENQSFMIGVNRIGVDGNHLEYEKSSVIISPTGIKLNPLESDSEYDVFEIDIDDAVDYRKNFPVKADRKIEFYKSIL